MDLDYDGIQRMLELQNGIQPVHGAILGTVAGFLFVAYLFFKTTGFHLRKWKGREMSEEERREEERRALSDAICDGIENSVYHSKLTRRAANFWYMRIGQMLSLPDLIPRSQKNLKKSIKRRLRNGTYDTSNRIQLPDGDASLEIKLAKLMKTQS